MYLSKDLFNFQEIGLTMTFFFELIDISVFFFVTEIFAYSQENGIISTFMYRADESLSSNHILIH